MGDSGGQAPALVLGPLLRYVGETAATIWVETDRACQVGILGRETPTFEVAGHHYALTVIDGLQPGQDYEYQVALDGTARWPEPGTPFPPSVIRTLDPRRPLRMVSGSCRIAELNPPRRWRRDRHEQDHGADAPGALALDLLDAPADRRPDLMLMIGDQVYADEAGPATRQVLDDGHGQPRTAGPAPREPGRELRQMVSDTEWQWVTESVAGDWDHVVLASSLPFLLPRGIHDLEAWNEAVCAGAWGKRFIPVAEKIRRAGDLEHWAAFGRSFTAFEQLITGLAGGARGTPPASVTVLGGDIHHSYLAEVGLPAGTEPRTTETAPRTAVYQLVCSPIHNLLPDSFRQLQRVVTSRAGTVIGGTLARLARVPSPQLSWRITKGPWFPNMLAVLDFDGRHARVRFDRSTQDPTQSRHLVPVDQTDLS